MTKAAEENASLRLKMVETMKRSAEAAANPPPVVAAPVAVTPPPVAFTASAAPAATLPPEAAPKRPGAQRKTVPVVAKKTSESLSTERIKRPSIRLTDDDLSRVREVMGHALSLRENISTTDVLRLALHEWDYRKLTPQKIGELRSQDGRRKSA